MADDWLTLFKFATGMIDRAETLTGSKIVWSIGGGTMLHQIFSHRHSKDIGIFLSDPQVLLVLSPRTNDVAERIANVGKYEEGSNFVKFATSHGEINFIVAPQLTKPHATAQPIGPRMVMVETPAEIMAKKLLYRAAEFTARDIFDLAFMIENGEADTLLMEEKPTYLPKLLTVLKRINSRQLVLRRAFEQIDVDRYKPTFDNCLQVIRDFIGKYSAG
jgi:hypothetical protein